MAFSPMARFIKQGEFYFASSFDWNPWTPSFPGDIGLISTWNLKEVEIVNAGKSEKYVIVDRSKQETFHCFMECSRKKHDAHYLGPNP